MARVGGVQPRRRGNRRHAVSGHDGEEHLATRPRRQQRSHAREHGVIVAEQAAQQRSPRKATAAALASTPITRVSGRAAAAASTWRPSPVPRSSAMPAWREVSSEI